MHSVKYLILFLLVGYHVVSAQIAPSMDTLFSLPDSTKPFTIGNFYELILQNHPVARQVSLLTDVAKQEIRLARGNFDPKLEAEFLAKNFDNKEYYSIMNSSLKFPMTIPIDPSIGMERNSGEYLNPERYISNEFDYRQFYAGISLPLGRGLITDDRRAALRQAELFKDMTEAEQVKLINKLLLDAAKEYWHWYYSYYNYRILNRGVVIASEIFRRVKVNYEFGEAAQVDTVQAQITLQQRLIEQQEAFLDFQNSGIKLSTFLWDSLANPLQLDEQWAPVLQRDAFILTAGSLEELSSLAMTNHPELQKLRIKARQLDVERKLAKEYLKPQLNLSYYFLNQPFNPEWNSSFQVGENYKVGVDLSFPLFIRKERAKLAQTKLKLSNIGLEQSLAERTILNELTGIYNQLVNLQSVILQQYNMTMNYERLLNAELLNLGLGESDLFKINVQQEKFIQSQSKWLKLMAEYEKQKAYLYWAAGTRNLNRF